MTSKYDPPERITWETPPHPERPQRKGSKWTPIADQLKANPGRWACIGRNMETGIVTVIRQAKVKCFEPEGSFEVMTRNHTSRWVADVYVRYVGENQEHA